MSKCNERGCRKIKMVCEDCDRIVSTAEFESKDSWKDIHQDPPPPDAPCEYKIEVTCKGWYRPHGDEPRFAGDERIPPHCIFTQWKPWDGPTFEEGVKLVRKFRQEMVDKENGRG